MSAGEGAATAAHTTEAGMTAVDTAVSGPSTADTSAADRVPGRVRRSARQVHLTLIGVAIALGLLQAAVWVVVAPVQRVKVYKDGSWASLPTSDWHQFDAAAIFVFSAAAIGLILAVAAWRIRAVRGVATLVAVLIGAVASAAVAYGLATLLARGIDPASVGATGHESIVEVASGVGTPLAMAIEPLVAVMVYTFLAAWDGRPDLGSPRATLADTGTSADAVGTDSAGSDEASAEEADQGTESIGDGHGDEPAADIAEGRP